MISITREQKLNSIARRIVDPFNERSHKKGYKDDEMFHIPLPNVIKLFFPLSRPKTNRVGQGDD